MACADLSIGYQAVRERPERPADQADVAKSLDIFAEIYYKYLLSIERA